MCTCIGLGLGIGSRRSAHNRHYVYVYMYITKLCHPPPHLFLLRRARVDSWRALKLNGTLVNYTQSRRGKSTIEKLYKEPDVLKMYLKGYNSLSSTSLPKTVDRYIPAPPPTPSSKYDNIPR